MGLLNGKIAIVTGCGRGLGEATAMLLAGEGAAVSISDIIPLEELEKKVGDKIRASGARVLCSETDTSKEEQVKNMVQRTIAEYGTIDILINNVGISGPTEDCWKIPIDEWKRTLAVNVDGTFLCSKAVIPKMIEKRWGRIVNLSSVTGKNPQAHRTPYATSKMGLIGFTRSLASEVGRYGITVNAVCPGTPGTERNVEVGRDLAKYLGQPFDPDLYRKMYEERRKSGVLAGKYLPGEGFSQALIEQEDVASLILFLCSDAACRITGQDINVSAGEIMW
ncbi:SDR family oxidoreductase [Candidatus Bathyarchaeota archaeon]|nr:SDR family oxidoreductase [Candidatus Bathyarchaeota archaeon]